MAEILKYAICESLKRAADRQICYKFTFSIEMSREFPSSKTQVDSSTLISCWRGLSMMGVRPFTPTVKWCFWIFTIMSLDLILKFN